MCPRGNRTRVRASPALPCPFSLVAEITPWLVGVTSDALARMERGVMKFPRADLDCCRSAIGRDEGALCFWPGLERAPTSAPPGCCQLGPYPERYERYGGGSGRR